MVDSEPGRGSCFRFNARFEFAGQAAGPTRGGIVSAPGEVLNAAGAIPSAPEAADFADARVLLVEDNAINQQVARELLAGLNLNVSVVDNGRAAVDAVREQRFSLVLMDIQMPEMDGYQATRQIRRAAGLQDLPIVAMTAHAMANERQRCLDAGMNDYISKPIDPRSLCRTLARWLPERTAGVAAAADAPAPAEPWVERGVAGVALPQALRRVRGNAAVLRQLLLQFYADHHDSGRDIVALLDRGDAEQAGRQLHALKGVAGNLGASELSECCAGLEQALAKNASADLAKLRGDFSAAFERLMAGLAVLDGEPKHRPDAAASCGDPAAVGGLLVDLEKCLRQQSFQAATLLAELGKALNGRHLTLFDKLAAHVDAFEFEHARRALTALADALRGAGGKAD